MINSRYLAVVSVERLLLVERYRQSHQAAASTHPLRGPGGPDGRDDEPGSRNGARVPTHAQRR